jgi:hypothetical protein
VTANRQGKILRVNPLTIVPNLDQVYASCFVLDFNLVGAGVDGVFNQFLDDGGWALDDLSGSNFIRN